MFIQTIYKSTLSVFDLQEVLKNKKMLLGFGFFIHDCPLHFFL